jgi:hypothetical protein
MPKAGRDDGTGVRPVGGGARAVPAAAGSVRVLGGPAHGFGRMWEKTYTAHLGAISPGAVMAAWQQSYPGLWPHRGVGGVRVLYADAESFTVTTGPGEPLASWITLCAEREGQSTALRVHVLMRAHDPLAELTLALGGYRRQDRFWVATISALAARLGVADPVVKTWGMCLDARHQWRNTGNLRRSPVLRGVARLAAAPAAVLWLGFLGLRTRMPG